MANKEQYALLLLMANIANLMNNFFTMDQRIKY